jgi:hypothetical protein
MQSLDLSGLAMGAYFLRTDTGTQRFMIQR